MADDVAHGVVEADIERSAAQGAVEDAIARRDGAAELGGGLPDDLGPVVISRFGRAILVWCTKDTKSRYGGRERPVGRSKIGLDGEVRI